MIEGHINWTNSTVDLLTTGSITGGSFVTGGDIGVSGDTDLLQLVANALTVNGAIDGKSSIACTSLTFDFATQDYKFTSRGGSQFVLQSQTSNLEPAFEIFTKDGDGGNSEDVIINLWGKGLPADTANREVATFSYTPTALKMYTSALGTGTVLPVHIYTGANTSQLILNTDNSISMSGNLTVNDLIIGDARYIGSASDTDAIQIEADGDVVFSQEVQGGIFRGNYFYHSGDADTGIIFGDDYFYFQAGSFDMLRAVESARGQDEVVVNEGQIDIDFRVEGNTTANLLQIDASTDRVGINIAAPSVLFSVNGVSRFGDDATNYSSFSATGDQTFTGSAGFYPRFLTQSAEPAAGTGATQCDTSEMVVWKDSDDSKVYLCFNDGGTVKTVELA
jgi:hypothetical protein